MLESQIFDASSAISSQHVLIVNYIRRPRDVAFDYFQLRTLLLRHFPWVCLSGVSHHLIKGPSTLADSCALANRQIQLHPTRTTMKCSDSDRETLMRIYQGSKLASNRRRISPNTKTIYEILARRTKEALNDNRTTYDRAAAIRDIDEIRAINSYVRKRDGDMVLLENSGHLARLADYAMVFCESLKAIEGTRFQHMFWVDIVDQLDREL